MAGEPTGSGQRAKQRARALGLIEASLMSLVAWLILTQIGDGSVNPGVLVGPVVLGLWTLAANRD